MDSVKQVVELGSFGVLVMLLSSLVWVVKTVVPRLVARLDAHLEKMEVLQRELNATLQAITSDNRQHYYMDSVEQKAIDERLSKILVVIEAEHEKTRETILEAMRT